jgi:hypothetical protein
VRTKQRGGRTPARMSKRKWDQTGDGLDDTPSKVSKTEDGKSASEAAAAAVSIPATNHHPLKPVGSRCSALLTVFFLQAAIAAKIAAQFSGGSTTAATTSKSTPSFAGTGATVVTDDKRKDPHDSEFTCDIEINDVRNRYLLTKGATQQEVSLTIVGARNIARLVLKSTIDLRRNFSKRHNQGCLVS